MYVFITILIIFICLLMMLVILVQNPKGGGLGSAFGGGGGNMMGGVKQTTDFLDKATWALIVALFVLSIVTTAFLPEQRGGGSDVGNETLIESIEDSE
ncbi:MAG: preprotein translocase subunit SecG [Chitinophagales bacterium]